MGEFELLLPKRIYFWQKANKEEVWSFLAYNDYQYLWEEDAYLEKWLKSALYYDKIKIESKEHVLESEIEEKLILKPE